MPLFEHVAQFATQFIDHHGLPGAAVLMAMESMILPIPSEAVMPFVGFLVHDGRFDLSHAIIATTLGSLTGSLISYALGYFGGKPAVMKVGRLLLLNEQHLDWTTAWFHKHGGITVFISRFIPVIRHLISIPAGMGRMPVLWFSLYTVLGATLWNSALLFAGYKLRQHWGEIMAYSHPIDIGFGVACVLVVAAWIYLHLKRPQTEKITRT